MNALGHWGEDEDNFDCDTCNRTFISWDGCRQHMSALNHWHTDKCDTCDKRFSNKTEAGQHMDSVGHRSSPYCTSCERYFQDLSDLYLHFNSPIHLRVDPTHLAPTPPVRLASVSCPATDSLLAPPAVVLSSPQPTANPHRASHLEPVLTTVSARPAIATPPVNPTPAINAPQTALSVLVDTWPVMPSTMRNPFEDFIEMDNHSSTKLHYQSITFMRPHQTFSFEELRLSDYNAGCKPTTGRAGAVVRAIYRDQATQTDTDTALASLAYVPTTSAQASTTDPTVHDLDAKGRDSINTNPSFSPSEIGPQQTGSVVRPRVLSCPFCQSGFNAVWEVAEHLESTSCEQSPDLDRSSIHHRQCQQDPDEVMTVRTTDRHTNSHKNESLLYRCPNRAGSCKGKFMSSFTELLAHLESEVCGFIKREDLWKDISECKNLWKDIDDCQSLSL
jgi:hypothetical protein